MISEKTNLRLIIRKVEILSNGDDFAGITERMILLTSWGYRENT